MEQTLTSLHLLAKGLDQDTETWTVRPSCSTDSYMLYKEREGGGGSDPYCIALSFQWNVTSGIHCG